MAPPLRARSLLLAALLVAAPLAVVLLSAPAGVEPPPPFAPADDGGALARFVLLGDTGTGRDGQRRVAEGVERVCAARGCDFAIIAGDLIYEAGVDGPHDPQFETKFEEPYRDLDMTFYLALGNHDVSHPGAPGQGTDASRGDHMVAYHHRDDRPSGRWHLPARHYAERVGENDTVHLLGLDTTAMMAPGAPADPPVAAQAAWLDAELEGSVARWKVAFGHHPLRSNGQHGDAGSYDGAPGAGAAVESFLLERVCGEVDLYLGGHDHDLQWLRPVPECGATQLLVSGAGAKTRSLADPGRHPAYFQRGDALGFFWLALREESFVGAAYDADGRLLFEREVPKPLP